METEKIISNATLNERADALIEYHKKIRIPWIPSLEELKAKAQTSLFDANRLPIQNATSNK